jgi:hypothetical protein
MLPRSNALADAAFRNLTRLAAFAVFSLLAAILVSLAIGAVPSIKAFGVEFLWTEEWDPVQEKFGALVPIVGTLVTSAIALGIAIPVSFGIAIFLTELSPVWLRRPLGTAIEMLAAIPSIIYGMWGLFIFAPLFQAHVQPFLQKTVGAIPGLGAAFLGPADRHRHARRRHHPRGDGDPVHHRRDAGCLRARAGDAQGIVVRAGLDHVGGGLAGGPALHQGRRHRRHHAGPGTRARRDDGGHVRDRNAHRLKASLFAPGNSIASASPTSSPRPSATSTRRR